MHYETLIMVGFWAFSGFVSPVSGSGFYDGGRFQELNLGNWAILHSNAFSVY